MDWGSRDCFWDWAEGGGSGAEISLLMEEIEGIHGGWPPLRWHTSGHLRIGLRTTFLLVAVFTAIAPSSRDLVLREMFDIKLSAMQGRLEDCDHKASPS
jgi:hypothetical protein